MVVVVAQPREGNLEIGIVLHVRFERFLQLYYIVYNPQ